MTAAQQMAVADHRHADMSFTALEAIRSGDWDPWLDQLAGAIRLRAVITARSAAQRQQRDTS